jgi:hypothetical protein
MTTSVKSERSKVEQYDRLVNIHPQRRAGAQFIAQNEAIPTALVLFLFDSSTIGKSTRKTRVHLNQC